MIRDSCIIVALYKVVLASEKAQLFYVDVPSVLQDPTAEEIGLVIEIKKTQILNLVEVLHLETKKSPLIQHTKSKAKNEEELHQINETLE